MATHPALPRTTTTSTHYQATTLPDDLDAVRVRFAELNPRLRAAGVALRPPPPEPTTCCGRGCNGCVWEGFYAAAAWWCEDAEQALAAAACAPAALHPAGASAEP